MDDAAERPELPPVDDMLCFALYAASRAVTARYRPLLEPFGLTYPQYLVLLVLIEESTSTVRDIGTRLELDSGTLSPLLGRLEARGVVVRHRSAVDERTVEVSLTDHGRDLAERLEVVPPVLRDAFGLDDDAADDLQRRLRELADRVAGASRAATAARGR